MSLHAECRGTRCPECFEEGQASVEQVDTALLEALEAAERRLSFLDGLQHSQMACGHIDNAYWLAQIRAAIAQAKGESNG